MAETHGFYRLPADGSGKRVPATVMLEFEYHSKTGTIAVGDTLTFSSSTFSAIVVEVDTGASGEIHALLPDPVPATPQLVLNENILVNATPVAQVNSVGFPFYFGQAVIVGGRTVNNHLEIDRYGSALTRFTEGSPQFDSFGKLQVSEQHTIGEYLNVYGLEPGHWNDITVGGGTIAHIPANQGVLLSCGTASGDKAERITHLYHPYQLGTSQLCEMTLAVGDTGKTNVNRIWGYGDDSDGLFFLLEGTTFNVLMRSTTGVGEMKIPQSQWNLDRLDGSNGFYNRSGNTLDVSKDNIYWIDLQWLGAGRVRFGVIMEGVRITCHEMYHSNRYSVPYIRSGSLPCYVEQENTGVAGSTSELRVWCFAVKTEGIFDPKTRNSFAHMRPTESLTGGVVDGDVYKKLTANYHPGRPLFSFRAKQVVNGVTVRTIGLPKLLPIANEGNYPVVITARRNATLTGANWTDLNTAGGVSAAVSNFEMDDKGEMVQTAAGYRVGQWQVGANETTNIDLGNVFDFRAEKVILHQDGLDQDEFKVTFTIYNMAPIKKCTGSNLTYDNTAKTIVRATGDFTADGFAADHVAYIKNGVNNGKHVYIAGVTATTLTLHSSTTLVEATNESGTEIHGGETTKVFAAMNMREVGI